MQRVLTVVSSQGMSFNWEPSGLVGLAASLMQISLGASSAIVVSLYLNRDPSPQRRETVLQVLSSQDAGPSFTRSTKILSGASVWKGTQTGNKIWKNVDYGNCRS